MTKIYSNKTNPEKDTLKLEKRIGSTTYMINIRFSYTNEETIEDKIIKLIKSQVNQSA